MAYKEIISLDSDVTYAIGGTNRKTGKKNPTQVEGYFLGSKRVESKKAKSGFSYLHYFQTSKGNVGVWGKTDMDRQLATAEKGAMTLVKFDKMKPTPNGDMYKFSVAQDSDNTIEVSSTDEASDSGYTEESQDEQDSAENEETDGSNEDDEDAVQAQALAAAERKAKVNALLNGKGKTAKN